MSSSAWSRPRRSVLAAAAGAGMVAATLSTTGVATAAPPSHAASAAAQSSTSSAGSQQPFEDGQYVVAFAESPAASYRGGLRGFAATAPAKGQKFNPNSRAAQRYVQHLEDVHAHALSEVGADAFHEYSVAFNGVAARLTAEQALALSKDPRVLRLVEDELSQPTTNASPEYLGLPDGLWADAGGQENAGEGVIIGVLDTGIWPENPSFAGSDDKRTRAGRPVPAQGIRKDWNGQCVAGEQFDVQDCNDKLIGARYYLDGFGRGDIAQEEYLSPRDGDGHGSHTASTAAGNPVEDVVVDGTEFGAVSGMAPAAQIAAYKVCWTGKSSTGCASSDSIAAIDDAVADGVDVINYSIGSGSESEVYDPVEFAFLNAAAAGVFVAASAGNSGPDASTLDHPSPWLTTVAASTHKVAEQKLVLGNGDEFIGASTTASLGSTEMVLAVDAAAPGVSEDQAAICNTGTLDPAVVSGKLVVCERRGLIARIVKSFEVARAGGAGMVLINNPENSLNGDLHAVPSVHIQADALAPVHEYVEAGGATGAIVPLAEGDSDTAIPEIAAFSSRGPSTTTGGDVLKPDIAAPGVDVLAAVAPPFHFGRDYDMVSGTSMASPHIAGLAAVIRAAKPDWSPMAVKSALMTTARDHVSTSNPFDQGAGFVQPNGATDPGVVFEHELPEWAGYLEDVLQADIWEEVAPLDGSELNQASIAIGQLAGTETVTRTLTSVSGEDETSELSAELDGVDVAFSPESVTVPAGGTAAVEVTFTRTDAAYGEYATGYLTANSGTHAVRLPLAVRPVAAAVDPAEVHGTGPDGSADVAVTAGFAGTMTTSVTGLVGVVPEADSVPTGSYSEAFDPLAPAPHESVDIRDIEVSDETSLMRLAVDGADGNDLDLWLYKVDGDDETLVSYSATGSGDETVTLVDPAPGLYRAYVHGWGVPTDGTYTWSEWLLTQGTEGNLSVTPEDAAVTTGETVDFGLTWAGLDAGTRYLGWVGFHDGDVLAGRTIVSVN